MPMPAFVAPAIGAAASIFGNIFGASNVNRQNEKSLQYAKEMYAQQRRDALSDWAMQNEYNSPAAQMQRLRDAKLNPALVYGEGAVANSSAVPRSVNAESWKPEAFKPDYSGVGQSLAQMYDIQLREAQTDNLREQTNVAQQESALKAAQVAGTLQSTAKSEFELALAKDLRMTTLETAAANLRRINVDTGIALQANERAAVQNTSSLMEAAQRILTMRAGIAKTADERREIEARIKNIGADTRLKNLDANLKKLGIQPGDNIALRMLGQWLGKGASGVRLPTMDDVKPSSIPDSTLRAFGLGDVLDGGDPYYKK